MRPTFSAAPLIFAATAAILTSTACASKVFVPHIVSERVTVRDVEARSIAAAAIAVQSGQPPSPLTSTAAAKSAAPPITRAPKRNDPSTAGTSGFSYADALAAAFGGGSSDSSAKQPSGGTALPSSPWSKGQPVSIALVAWLVVVVLVGVLSFAMFYLNRARWQRTSKQERAPQAEPGVDDFATEFELPRARP